MSLKALFDLKPQVIAKFALFGAILAGMYYPAYAWLIRKDWPREDYNYCYLIPLVVLYLIWEKREELAAEPAAPSWRGLFLLVPGILLFWVGELAGELYSLYLSSWLVAVGILWMHIGWRKMKAITFALFMALTMFPLPVFLNTKLTSGLKLVSSQLGVAMLQLYGMSAYREGNIIDLGFTQLQVVDACSGLRYLYPLLVMGILISYFYRAALWKRLVLVVSTIPLTIVVNSLRIALTGVIHKHWGAAVAEGFFHGFSGWLIFMITLGVLLAEVWVLRRIAPGASESFFARPGPVARHADVATAPAGEGHRAGFLKPPQFVAAVVLLALTLGGLPGRGFPRKNSTRQALQPVPSERGGMGRHKPGDGAGHHKRAGPQRLRDDRLQGQRKPECELLRGLVREPAPRGVHPFPRDVHACQRVDVPPGRRGVHPPASAGEGDAGEPGHPGKERGHSVFLLLVPGQGANPDERLGDEAVHVLGLAHKAADGRRPGEADHAGVPGRESGGCGSKTPGLHDFDRASTGQDFSRSRFKVIGSRFRTRFKEQGSRFKVKGEGR